MKLLVLGASGGVGRLITAEAAARGWPVRAQGRDAARLAARLPPGPGVEPAAADPTDPAALARLVGGREAVAFALGVDRPGPTTLFSDATRALIPAMEEAGVRRLVAVTGVGCGETRGHGGWFYDRVIFPLFTRARYADKDRQEALIRESRLAWTLVRPAPFSTRPSARPLEAHTTVPPGLVLTHVTRAEVAAFVVETLASGAHVGEAVFLGRRGR
jgi:uncharacterized protein YbjT (DUF2867 family)